MMCAAASNWDALQKLNCSIKSLIPSNSSSYVNTDLSTWLLSKVFKYKIIRNTAHVFIPLVNICSTLSAFLKTTWSQSLNATHSTSHNRTSGSVHAWASCKPVSCKPVSPSSIKSSHAQGTIKGMQPLIPTAFQLLNRDNWSASPIYPIFMARLVSLACRTDCSFRPEPPSDFFFSSSSCINSKSAQLTSETNNLGIAQEEFRWTN